MFVILSITSKAESVYQDPLERFFNCTVVVDGNYVKSNKQFFWIRINYVIRDDSLGLKPGDYLKIQNGNIEECGFPTDVSKISRAYYYLSKIPNTWKVYRNEPSSIQSIRKDSMYVGLRDTLLCLNGNEFRGLMTEFANTFIWNKTYHHADLKVSSEEFLHIKSRNIIVQRFSKTRRNLAGIEFTENRMTVYHQEPLPDPPVYTPPKPIQHCPLLEEPAYYKTLRGDSLFPYFKKHISYPTYLKEMGIEGKVIVEFIVETDGDLSNFEVKRGLHKDLDSIAIEVLDQMPKWTPAKQRGQTERCKMIVPVRFDLE